MRKGCFQSPDVSINLNVRGMPPSATISINERCAQLQQEGKEVFRLGLGQSPFPVPRPVGEELQRHAFKKEYLPVKGLPELRHAVAEHHRRRFDIQCSSENVLIGPGSKELMFLLQLVYYGEIIIPTPAWVSYAPQARIIGRQITTIATSAATGWRLTPRQLDNLCRHDPTRPRILVLNYPSNPTGGTYPRDELQEISEVARRYRVVVLSDEIYGKLHHRGEHSSIVPLYPEGTIFSGGLSKWCGAGGWRLGLFVIPDCLSWLSDAMAAVASETFTSTSAPVQYAAIRAFTEGEEIDNYIRGCRKILRPLGTRIAQMLTDSGATVVPPEGGFYVFPDFSAFAEPLRRVGIRTSTALCERLLKDTGVAVLPGRDFGRPANELTARIAYVDFDGERALDALGATQNPSQVDDAFLETHCERVLTAVGRTCAWLHEVVERKAATKTARAVRDAALALQPQPTSVRQAQVLFR